MAVNDDILNAIVKRSTALELYKNGEWRKIRRLLRQVERDLIEAIESNGVGRTINTARTQTLLRAVQRIIKAGADDFYRQLNGTAGDIAQAEAEWVAGSLGRTVPVAVNWVVPSAALIRAAAVEQPFGMGERIGAHTLNEYVNRWRDNLSDRTIGAIRVGVIEGEGIDDIVRRIRGTRQNNFSDGLMNISRNSARTLVRTAVNHVATKSRETVYEQHKDIIRGVVWVSVLDSRTSTICASRDGNVYPVGKGPRPPAHPNCRSTTTPVTRNSAALAKKGVRLTKGQDGLTGEVPAETNYEAFLRNQPESFQDTVLGKTKAKAFRNGTPLDKFVTDEGRVLTLEELGLVSG